MEETIRVGLALALGTTALLAAIGVTAKVALEGWARRGRKRRGPRDLTRSLYFSNVLRRSLYPLGRLPRRRWRTLWLWRG